MLTQKNLTEPSPLLWLRVPLFILALSIVLRFIGEDIYRLYMLGERGVLEVSTLLFLAVAVYLGVRLFLSMPYRAPVWLRWWVLLITLGSVFFLGEEASWGQHLFGWDTGEEWSRLNQQGETNLHNLTEFGFIFDQLPRNLLTAAALVGGILVPLYRRIRHLQWTPADGNYWLWPTLVCTPVAFLGVFISVPEKLFDAALIPRPDVMVNFFPGEHKEFYLAFFIMLYLLSLHSRLAAAYPGTISAGTPGSR